MILVIITNCPGMVNDENKVIGGYFILNVKKIISGISRNTNSFNISVCIIIVCWYKDLETIFL